jgi:cytidine deaminase
MKEKIHSIKYNEYASLEGLPEVDQNLLILAVESADNAYAPYSNFNVGAALSLVNGTIVIGSNQENAAYPSGLCAERVAIFAASANNPGLSINTIAIFAKDSARSNDVISPCGSCRQVISEYEHKQNKPIRILLMNSNRMVWEFFDVESLLPFSFKLDQFKK